MVPTRNRWSGWLIGVSSVVAGLAMAQLVSSLKNGLTNPVVSIGNQIIDHVPGGVKEFAIKVFGVNDKTALVVSICIVLLAFAIAIGRAFASGNTKFAFSMVVILTLIGVAASLFDSRATALSPFPSLVAGGTAILVLRWFKGQVDAIKPSDNSVNRRELLRMFGLIGLGVAATLGAAKFLRDHASAQLQKINIALPKPLKFLPVPPSDPALTITGLSTLFTPNSEFYRIDTAIDVPHISIDSWRLKIDGMVANPREFTYQELISRPVFEMDDTIACVSNQVGGALVGNARWLGIRLDDLIKEASPSASADQVMGYSSDGFSAGFPFAVLDGRNAMIAIGMNGQPLPVEHGFPARIIVPGLYGYVSATKWLTDIELTRFDQKQGYWIPRGWSALGPIKTESRIDTPWDGSTLKSATTAIAGVAWAPTRGISRVEVRVSEGPWRDATLGPELAKTTWRQWWIDWPATPGQFSISVRATDGTGVRQSSRQIPVVPNGAEGWHTIHVTVR
jgi:DMSO/TMAO reductase YedYZ molybdopterin-dependent catalytic subunit